jgi:hypothetical protein
MLLKGKVQNCELCVEPTRGRRQRALPFQKYLSKPTEEFSKGQILYANIC